MATLCNPIDGSPPGSPVPEILQARTLEWVAIPFSNAGKRKVKVKSLSRVQLFATPWTAAYQAPPSMGYSRQEYWMGYTYSILMQIHAFSLLGLTFPFMWKGLAFYYVGEEVQGGEKSPSTCHQLAEVRRASFLESDCSALLCHLQNHLTPLGLSFLTCKIGGQFSFFFFPWHSHKLQTYDSWIQ